MVGTNSLKLEVYDFLHLMMQGRKFGYPHILPPMRFVYDSLGVNKTGNYACEDAEEERKWMNLFSGLYDFWNQ